MKTIAFLLEFGFEEIETIVPVDILRRLGFNVIIAGAKDIIEGSHGLKLKPDIMIKDIDCNKLDAVVLPGGMPGSINLAKNPNVLKILKEMEAKNALIAAICAAPIALAAAGLITGIKITAH
ncbi:MAG TPA: DJ-1/PfpI family protein, partial [Victivallales bacterium]|nr:DJ-1/PfpI family protein [Victivallales bacterium]